MNTYRTIQVTLLAVAIAATCSWANAQDAALFESHVTPNAVMFDPTDYASLDAKVDLIVKGPENFYLRKSFAAGTPIEFAPAIMAEGGLLDGSYRYELQIMGINGVSRDRNNDEPMTTEPLQGTSGSFSVLSGQIVTSNLVETPYAEESSKSLSSGTSKSTIEPVRAYDQQILDDLIVTGGACIGLDCVNGENFGFDTIRLKENNLRIKFDDTSSSASFPSVDWQLTANESSNGGLNKFSIEDVTNARVPFTVEASAPSHSLYVDDAGRVGLGTSTPVVEAHIKDGDSPTMRLEQDGSSGFTAQTWDVAGNETNFFVRDVTNGSTLPFRIRPSAPSNSVYIDTDGDIGLGTSSPDAPLEVSSSESFNFFRLTATGAAPNASVDFTYTDAAAEGELRINIVDGDAQEFALDDDGNLTIMGSLTANGSVFPDYVFADDYVLMPLNEVQAFIEKNRHLPNVPSAKEIEADGLNMTDMQKLIMEKVEELTLYTIQQQETIEAQGKLIAELRSEIDSLK
ncbi:hypothetical protein [Gilvimarinus sp. 1_MG-2023]|uniref:hypothetical protein n=1 Tax=Gilvimarinus sp. 1_MG-2023 TaxID=3062638 RepID=UPI0026E36161|nr:hypothetical protein [Gilvimarinus sp. 1_MG-2023]MDO6746276.1 hypothetical protein [Gilvimarinus sp. 1_MG-2023]